METAGKRQRLDGPAADLPDACERLAFYARKTFCGCLPDYVFARRAGGVGYFLDAKPVPEGAEVPANSPGAGAAASDDATRPMPAPPQFRAGQYVRCAYYSGNIYEIGGARLSKSRPHFWTYELTGPRAHGIYNWVGERYLISHSQDVALELDPANKVSWLIDDPAVTLDPEAEHFLHEHKVRRQAAKSDRQLNSQAGVLVVQVQCTQIKFQGRKINVAHTAPPKVSIRDMVAVLFGQDEAQKRSFSVKHQILKRGFVHYMTHRFGARARFATAVIACNHIGILLDFVKGSSDGAYRERIKKLQASPEWLQLLKEIADVAPSLGRQTGALTAASRPDLAAGNASVEQYQAVLVGEHVQKHFDGYGTYEGEVIRVYDDIDEAQNVTLFKVNYEDGDVEDIRLNELKNILVDKSILGPPAPAEVSEYTSRLAGERPHCAKAFPRHCLLLANTAHGA